MKITMVQSRGHVDDVKQGFFKARMRINNIDSDIFVFPEMYCSGYVSDKARFRLDVMDTLVISKLKELSTSRNCAILCGCPVDDDGKMRNSMLFIVGQDVVRHDKTCLTVDGLFDEEKVFVAGNTPTLLEHKGVKLAIGMGEEVYSEELMEWYASKGADMIVLSSAYDKRQMDRAIKVAVARAAEHSIYVMMVNMVGPDSGVEMGGNSVLIGPDGEILERCTGSSDVREIRTEDSWFTEAKAGRVKRKKPKLKLD